VNNLDQILVIFS